jgi:hypothetical protein
MTSNGPCSRLKEGTSSPSWGLKSAARPASGGTSLAAQTRKSLPPDDAGTPGQPLHQKAPTCPFFTAAAMFCNETRCIPTDGAV